MKKLTILTVILTASLMSSAIAYAGECPSWVPEEKCEYFEVVLQAARQHAKTLDAPPMVVDAYVANQYLFIVTKRAQIVSRVKLGKFEEIKNVEFDGNTIEFEYYTDVPKGKRFMDMAIGGIVGFFTGGGLVLVLLLL